MKTPIPCVLVAEVSAPPQTADRESFATQLSQALATLTSQWPEVWLAAPRLLENTGTGIEETAQQTPIRIQAELLGAGRAFDATVALRLALWPQQVRVYISDCNHQVAWKNLRSSKAGFSVELVGLAQSNCKLIASAAQLHAAMMQDWKPSRAKAAVAMRECKNQNEAAVRLGIRQQSVSEALRAGHAKELLACEHAIRACLEELDA